MRAGCRYSAVRGRPVARSLVVALAVSICAIGAPALCAAVPTAREAVLAPLADRSLLLDIKRVGSTAVVVGERGHVLLLAGGDQHWRQQAAPTRAMLTAVYFHDPQLGWAVGHDATILRTSDGGRTWSQVYAAPQRQQPLLDLWFADTQHGYAIGAYGLFLESRDGGLTWKERTISEDDYHLNHISHAGDGRLYIAAEAGRVYRSDDGGRSWLALPSPYSGSFFGTLPLARDTLLLFGLRGKLFRSEDAGATWTAVPTGTQAMLTEGIVLADGTVVVVGMEGAVLVSRDGGRSFKTLQLQDRKAIAGGVEAGAGHLLLVGEFGIRTLAKEFYLSRP